MDQLLARAEREVLILDRPPYLNPWAVAGADPGTGIAALLERGVTVRVVLAREGLALPGRTRLLGPPVDRALWERALPLGGAGPRLSDEHRDLLGLLAGGFKDEVIARRRGVHVHTATTPRHPSARRTGRRHPFPGRRPGRAAGLAQKLKTWP
ncbi:hypothetical protein [Streptomyces flavofungini]|nr:hypothetical protein [Streptomyces flavofungini]